MSDMETNEGTTLPVPLSRTVHRHSYQTRDGYGVATVLEIEHRDFYLLSASGDHQVADYLAGIVALRLLQGLTLVSLTDTSACLSKGE